MKWLKKKRVHNARKPKGFWGIVTLSNMNKDHESLMNRGLEYITIKKDDICLDVGCGGGKTLQLLARQATEGRIYGIDVSDVAVGMAKVHNKKEVYHGRIIVKKCSVNNIIFPENSFNVVTAVETFYFWEDKPLALNNVYNVLKKDGTLIIMLDAYEDGSHDLDEIKQEIKLDLVTPEQATDLLKNAGFSEVTVTTEGKRLFAIARKK